MSEKKLSDVFSDLDLKFIEESDPSLKVKKKPFPIWIVPVAAVFTVLLAVTVFFKYGRLNNVLKPFILPPNVTKNSSVYNGTDYNPDEINGDDNSISKDADISNADYTSDNQNGNTPDTSGYNDMNNGADSDDDDQIYVPGTPYSGTPQTGTPAVFAENQAYYNAVKPYIISKHKYPDYPVHYLVSSDSDKDQNEKYKEWFDGKRYKRELANSWQPATNFIKTSSSVFLSDTKGKNAVYSPANAYFAFSLLAETTGGNSRKQILSALNEASITDLRSRANKIWNYNYANDGLTLCLFANSIWLNDKCEYNKDTLDTIAENYYASSFSGEMGSDGYNDAFRAWLNTQTNNLLKNQIYSLRFTEYTDFSIASTVMFNAKWSEQFSEEQTYKQDFKTPDKTVSVDFMHKSMYTGDDLYYGDYFTATDLYFEDSSGSMVFILPKAGISPELLLYDEETMNFIVTNTWVWSKSEKYKINYSIPKFDVSSQFDLASGMKKLGITDCFNSSKADFSPLSKQNFGALTQVNHGARVLIDEEGVTAASYMVIEKSGAAGVDYEEYDFTLDRPFIFVIKGTDGLPLFIGIVNNP